MSAPTVLFLQCTDPALYPPIVNAATLLADKGWNVAMLSSPIRGIELLMPADSRLHIEYIRERASQYVGKLDYGRYLLAAAAMARRFRPDVIYASDMPAAGPALLAQRLCGAKLLYHEHDSPEPAPPGSYLKRMRGVVIRTADTLVFPNSERADIVRRQYGIGGGKIQIVWNVPRLDELPTPIELGSHPLRLYYHGSITPDRLPKTLIPALQRFDGAVQLSIVGYEAPSAAGYAQWFVEQGVSSRHVALVHYLGQISRDKLLAEAARHHVGLALMPSGPADVNMRCMVGASVKVFDCLAAGLPLLVTDSPEWNEHVVAPGYARACDPTDVESVVEALQWYLDNPISRRDMGMRGRTKITLNWNYEATFAPVLNRVDGWAAAL